MLSAAAMVTFSVSARCADPTLRGEHSPRFESAISPDYPWSAHVAEAAKRFGIPERLLRAVMQAESAGDVHAVSSKGALGLMQIMPATWEELRIKYRLGVNPYQPRGNILAGAAYLREMLDRFGRNGFLAAYNAGPGRYEEHLVTGRPLPRETIDYVRKLAPLIDGSVPIPTRSRQREGRANARDSVIFTRVANTRDGLAAQGDRETDVSAESVFTAIRPASLRAPGRAVADLTGLVAQPDGSRTEGVSVPNPAIRSPFAQNSAATPQ